MGRSDSRNLVGCVIVISKPKMLFEVNQALFKSWVGIWSLCHVLELMDPPKRFKKDLNIKQGDVMLFLKQKSMIYSKYKYRNDEISINCPRWHHLESQCKIAAHQ